MSIRKSGSKVWIASLLACVMMAGVPALAQDASEKRFKLSAPETNEFAPEASATDHPTAVGQAGDVPSAQRISPESSVSSDPSSTSQRPAGNEPIPPAPSTSGQAGETGAPTVVQGQPHAEELVVAPIPEDDLPPPMNVEREAGRTSASTQGVQGAQSPQLAGKPLEIVPIREGKLSNLSAEDGQSAEPAKSEKPAQAAKSVGAGQPVQTGKFRTARPFWLDPKRHAADLSFKQGAVAFILDADIGRRGKFKTFLLDSPARRVVDIPGRWRYDGPTDHPVRFDGVGSIRVGEHPEYLRIVFDYVRGESRPPTIHTTPDGVAVIYFWGE